MLQQHPNIKRAVINDINSDLITCYRTVRDNVERLIPSLRDIQAEYYALPDMEAKREMFMTVRQRYNEKNLDPIENTTNSSFESYLLQWLVSCKQERTIQCALWKVFAATNM